MNAVWFGSAEKRDFTFNRDGKKANQPVIKAMINMTDLAEMMISTGNDDRWPCIKNIIAKFDTHNATFFVYNLIIEPTIGQIRECQGSSPNWFDTLSSKVFHNYWWAWLLAGVIGILLIIIIIRVCCYACKKKDDNDVIN